jgi:L-asparagine oxygenase
MTFGELRAALEQRGWGQAEAPTDAAMLSLASSLGEPAASPGRAIVQALPARREGASPRNSMSGLFGLDEFPLHTDGAHWHCPPRFVLLRSANGRSSTPTIVVDSQSFLTSELRQEWGRATWKVTGIARPFACSMMFQVGPLPAIRWDPCCLSPYGRKAQHLAAVIEHTLADARRNNGVSVGWTNSKEVLVIDNWRLLHSRPALASRGERRELRRVLVMES